MLERKARAPSETLRPMPFGNALNSVEERDRLPGDVTRGAKGERAQMAARNARAHASPVDTGFQKLPQRAIVEKRLGRREHHAAGSERHQPMQTSAQHVCAVHVEYLRHAEIPPHALEARNRAPPVMRFGSEHA